MTNPPTPKATNSKDCLHSKKDVNKDATLAKMKSLTKLLQSTTSGKWKVEDGNRVFKGQWEICNCTWQEADEEDENNAKFICKAHNTFPEIASSYEELVEENKNLKKDLEIAKGALEEIKNNNHSCKTESGCIVTEALSQLSPNQNDH